MAKETSDNVEMAEVTPVANPNLLENSSSQNENSKSNNNHEKTLSEINNPPEINKPTILQLLCNPCNLLKIILLLISLPLWIIQLIIMIKFHVALFPLNFLTNDWSDTIAKGKLPKDSKVEIKFPPQNKPKQELMNKFEDVKHEKLISNKKRFVQVRKDLDISTEERYELLVKLMLSVNVIESNEEEKPIPKELQGIFWLSGLGSSEHLACIEYAKFVENWEGQGISNLIAPNGFCTWGFENTDSGVSYSLRHGRETPGGYQHHMHKDPGTFKVGQVMNTMTENYHDVRSTLRLGHFNLDKIDYGTGNYSADYYRGCYWVPKVFGKDLEFGSYKLRQIAVPGKDRELFSDFEKIEPAWSECVRFMETQDWQIMVSMEMEEEKPPTQMV